MSGIVRRFAVESCRDGVVVWKEKVRLVGRSKVMVGFVNEQKDFEGDMIIDLVFLLFSFITGLYESVSKYVNTTQQSCDE